MKKAKPKKQKQKKSIGSGAEARVYATSPRRVERVMFVPEGWKEKNAGVLKTLRKLAKSKTKTRYLCPIYGVSVRKTNSTWRPYKVTITMARAKHTERAKTAAHTVPFRLQVKKECEKVGLRPPADWHSYNVMQLGKRVVRIDYFPWYDKSEPYWMSDRDMYYQ